VARETEAMDKAQEKARLLGEDERMVEWRTLVLQKQLSLCDTAAADVNMARVQFLL
jgi:hypothetical protein